MTNLRCPIANRSIFAWIFALLGLHCGDADPVLPSTLPPCAPELLSLDLINAEVLHYDYEFDTASSLASSQLRIRVNETDRRCIALSNRSRLRTAAVNGAPAQVCALPADRVALCGAPLGSGEISVSTTQEPLARTVGGSQGGLFKSTEPDGGSFLYLSNWIEECGRLGPCDERPSALATYTITVRHSSAEVALCPGLMTRGPEFTRCEIAGPQAPIYSALALLVRSQWQRSELVQVDDVSVVMYEKSGGTLVHALTAEKTSVVDFLRWIQALFGPLPYGRELRVVSAPTNWFGFEHPANLVLRQDLAAQRIEFENPVLHTFLHEVIHQWAGNRTTLASRLDFVWKEAIAEYLTYVFEDERRPAAEATKTRRTWVRQALSAPIFPRPLDEPDLPLELIAANAYGAGPMLMFLQLEPIVGRPVLLKSLQDFLHQPGARSTADWQTIVERTAGQPLDVYFRSWVFGRGEPEWPAFSLTTQQDLTQVTVAATQRSATPEPFPCVLEVGLYSAQGQTTVRLPFIAGAGFQSSITVPFADPLLRSEIDPQQFLVNGILR